MGLFNGVIMCLRFEKPLFINACSEVMVRMNRFLLRECGWLRQLGLSIFPPPLGKITSDSSSNDALAQCFII